MCVSAIEAFLTAEHALVERADVAGQVEFDADATNHSAVERISAVFGRTVTVDESSSGSVSTIRVDEIDRDTSYAIETCVRTYVCWSPKIADTIFSGAVALLAAAAASHV